LSLQDFFLKRFNEASRGKTAGYQKAPSLNPSPLDGGREGGGWRWFWEAHPEISRRARYNRSTASHAASGGELPVKIAKSHLFIIGSSWK